MMLAAANADCAGDPVKFVSPGFLPAVVALGFVQETVDVDEMGLVALGGMVPLAHEHGREVEAGVEVDAGLADRLERACELRGRVQ